MCEQKDLFLEKLKIQLDEWNAELNRLEAEIQEAKIDERIRYQKRISALREKEVAVIKTLEHVFEAKDDTWNDLKKGVGSVWSSLKSSVREAKSEFEKGLKEGMKEESEKDE